MHSKGSAVLLSITKSTLYKVTHVACVRETSNAWDLEILSDRDAGRIKSRRFSVVYFGARVAEPTGQVTSELV
jgi:hypothetical protein